MDILEVRVDRAGNADGCVAAQSVGIAVGVLGEGARGNDRASDAAKRGRNGGRRGRLAGQKVNAANGVLKAVGGILRVHLIDDKGDFVVLVPDYRGLAGSKLPLGSFKARIQAAAKCGIHVSLHAG